MPKSDAPKTPAPAKKAPSKRRLSRSKSDASADPGTTRKARHGEVTPKAREAADAVRAFAIEAARLVRDDKCEEVVLLDVRHVSQVTDYIIIGSGTSERQMRSVLQHVDELGGTRGYRAFRASTDDRAAWLLLDFVDVVVHLFEPNTRAHYDLETLWGDAPRVEWEREDQKQRDRAGLNA